METSRRGFLRGLAAVAAVAAMPVAYVRQKLAWVSVAWYGADGGGLTDDTAALRAAVESTHEGGVVYLPPGHYRVAGMITGNRFFRGEGPEKSKVTVHGGPPFETWRMP